MQCKIHSGWGTRLLRCTVAMSKGGLALPPRSRAQFLGLSIFLPSCSLLPHREHLTLPFTKELHPELAPCSQPLHTCPGHGVQQAPKWQATCPFNAQQQGPWSSLDGSPPCILCPLPIGGYLYNWTLTFFLSLLLFQWSLPSHKGFYLQSPSHAAVLELKPQSYLSLRTACTVTLSAKLAAGR